jgi:hypothetical protein
MSKNLHVNKPRSAPSGTDIVGCGLARSAWRGRLDSALWVLVGVAVPREEARILWQK